MSGPVHWEELRSADSGHLVLVVDWPAGPGDARASRDLVSLLDTPHAVWRTSGTAEPHHWEAGAREYVRPWAREVHDSGLGVRAVVACGVAGVLAAALAELVADGQGGCPEILLIDPEFVDPATVYDEFLAQLARLGQAPAAGGRERLERLRDMGASVVAECGEDLTILAARLHALLTEARGAPPPSSSTGLGAGGTGGFEPGGARLCALAVADRADVSRMWARGTALCSSSSGSGLNRTRAALLLPEAALVGREIVFDVDHAGLLRDAAVARTVSELIGA
ncbi:hypothetical protein GCM10018793_50680 [Streptomyces sulfonofaciens]|uniref:Uncharacterized protein n=1 Tax=Streptomyces sulfonofaciens TaxID=68272 RepID=A0A919GHH0_9ACTN|nr:hypothetical protein [Streptomyces sulfonofaciens]GHH84863.1 hypothetical protein GCM10018793_50680 [Streptomyces sulfonofaciens]